MSSLQRCWGQLPGAHGLRLVTVRPKANTWAHGPAAASPMHPKQQACFTGLASLHFTTRRSAPFKQIQNRRGDNCSLDTEGTSLTFFFSFITMRTLWYLSHRRQTPGFKQCPLSRRSCGMLGRPTRSSPAETCYVHSPRLTFLSCGIGSYKNGFL